MKLERYNFCDNTLRCNYHDIYDNIYEELADVTIMLFQFIYKNKLSQQNLLDAISMKINLNDILVNSYDRNMKQLIVIYDDNGDFYTFTESNILERIKYMKVERFDIVSEKLVVIKVVGVINE